MSVRSNHPPLSIQEEIRSSICVTKIHLIRNRLYWLDLLSPKNPELNILDI